MIQQLNQRLHPSLESLVPGNLDETYNKLPQPWGKWDQIVKIDEVSCTDVSTCVCRPRETLPQGPSMEKVCDCFTFLSLENYVDQRPVVFSVSERDVGVRFPWIEVTKASFQTD